MNKRYWAKSNRSSKKACENSFTIKIESTEGLVIIQAAKKRLVNPQMEIGDIVCL